MGKLRQGGFGVGLRAAPSVGATIMEFPMGKQGWSSGMGQDCARGDVGSHGGGKNGNAGMGRERRGPGLGWGRSTPMSHQVVLQGHLDIWDRENQDEILSWSLRSWENPTRQL